MTSTELDRNKALLRQGYFLGCCTSALCSRQDPALVCQLLDVYEDKSPSELSKSYREGQPFNVIAVYVEMFLLFVLPNEDLFKQLPDAKLKIINAKIKEIADEPFGFTPQCPISIRFIRNAIAHNHFNIIDGFFILENRHSNMTQTAKFWRMKLAELCLLMKSEVILPFVNGAFDSILLEEDSINE